MRGDGLGGVTITGSTGPLAIGACGKNTIAGSVSITGNSGGGTYQNNTVSGSLTITGNSGGENAAVWNGSAWTAQPTAGGPSEVLNAVSCSAVNSCEAVGSVVSQTLAEAWNGSTWTMQPTPSRSGFQYNFLNGVSCTSADSCTAVGHTEDIGGVTATLIETGD